MTMAELFSFVKLTQSLGHLGTKRVYAVSRNTELVTPHDIKEHRLLSVYLFVAGVESQFNKRRNCV